MQVKTQTMQERLNNLWTCQVACDVATPAHISSQLFFCQLIYKANLFHLLDYVNQITHEINHEKIFTAYEFFTLVPLNHCMYMPMKEGQGE